MQEAKDYLPTLSFWKYLTKQEQDACRKYTQLRTYKADSIIHSRDHECLGYIKVVSGRARTIMMSEEGREVTLYIMEEGDTDVLSASCVINQIRFETQMIADTDCELLVVPAVYLSELKEKNLAARCTIYECLSERFSDVMDALQRTLFTRIDSRIASTLIEQADETNGTIIKTTHEELARKINTSREVASRILKEMEEEGILKLHRGKIEVLDRTKLEYYIV